MGDHKLYLYPIWLRIWHALNAIAIIILIVTGISMQYSNPEFAIIQFDMAVLLHNIAGIFTCINYIFFIVFNGITANGKAYAITGKGLVDRLSRQSKYYMTGYFNGEPKPFPVSKENKFNPLQKVAYVVAMYVLIPLLVITGIALLYPEVILENVLKVSGIKLTALLHASLGFLISMFLVIHIYVASVGKHPLRNYRSIVNGYHEEQ